MNTLLKQGLEYEIYVKNIIKNKYAGCWLWRDIPREILLELKFIKELSETCDDIGCDILCLNNDGAYEYIQCKNYSTLGIDNTISISDLAGFYNFVAEFDIKISIVYYSGVLSKQILCRNRRIKYINLPIINISNVNLTPRAYQIDAFNTFNNIHRGILDMPCGTGKTLITYLTTMKYDNIILLSPLISTTNQLLIHYKNYYSNYKYKDAIQFNLIHSQGTRKLNTIELKKKNIIGATFDSCDIINKLLDKLTIDNTIGNTYIIIDECHNLSKSMLIDSKNEVNKILMRNLKILFVSATPKYYDNQYQNIFGSARYKLEWNKAIKNKYISNYNFYYPNTDKIIEYIDEIKFDKSIIQKTKLIYKAFFLLESIKALAINKCIVYLKTIEESEQFYKILGLVNTYHSLKLGIYVINCNTSKSSRNASLTKFRNDKIKISIILNVHILDEGIDIHECDSVFLTHPNNNPINIIQRISRANRIINGIDKIAKILIWGKDKIHIDEVLTRIEQYININLGDVDNKFINKNISIEQHEAKNNNLSKFETIQLFNKTPISNLIFNIYEKQLKLNDSNILLLIDNTNSIWFCYNDILNALGYKDSKTQKKRLALDSKYFDTFKNISEKLSINNKNNIAKKNLTMINESGLYILLNRSKKTIAKELSANIFSEIIAELYKKCNIIK